ncbi:MAG: WbqC family protein, partial [Flavobacteriales bacterium]|nr:WbqC family protein [Flavobacteriales bacterium]
AETWPQQHLHAVRTAYGSAPWSIHYLDAIEEVITRRYERLVDLDLATMRLGMAWLGLKTEVEVSEQYVEVASPESEVLSAESEVGSQERIGTDSRLPTTDYRTTIHPKRPVPPELQSPSYPQVFSARHGFQAGLSIIDLVCNCGPEAIEVITAKRMLKH